MSVNMERLPSMTFAEFQVIQDDPEALSRVPYEVLDPEKVDELELSLAVWAAMEEVGTPEGGMLVNGEHLNWCFRDSRVRTSWPSDEVDFIVG